MPVEITVLLYLIGGGLLITVGILIAEHFKFRLPEYKPDEQRLEEVEVEIAKLEGEKYVLTERIKRKKGELNYGKTTKTK